MASRVARQDLLHNLLSIQSLLSCVEAEAFQLHRHGIGDGVDASFKDLSRALDFPPINFLNTLIDSAQSHRQGREPHDNFRSRWSEY